MHPFPLMLFLFIFLAVIFALAWWGKHRLSMVLFGIFLIFAVLVFLHHATDVLNINL